MLLVDLDTATGDPVGIISLLRSELPEGRIVVWADDVEGSENSSTRGSMPGSRLGVVPTRER